jgi:hypothetical protein
MNNITIGHQPEIVLVSSGEAAIVGRYRRAGIICVQAVDQFSVTNVTKAPTNCVNFQRLNLRLLARVPRQTFNGLS